MLCIHYPPRLILAQLFFAVIQNIKQNLSNKIAQNQRLNGILADGRCTLLNKLNFYCNKKMNSIKFIRKKKKHRMKIIKNFFIKYMALIVLIVALVSLFTPQSALWISTSWINYLLMVVMFGMGMTLNPESFVLVFKRPKDILC